MIPAANNIKSMDYSARLELMMAQDPSVVDSLEMSLLHNDLFREHYLTLREPDDDSRLEKVLVQTCFLETDHDQQEMLGMALAMYVSDGMYANVISSGELPDHVVYGCLQRTRGDKLVFTLRLLSQYDTSVMDLEPILLDAELDMNTEAVKLLLKINPYLRRQKIGFSSMSIS